MSVLDSKDKPVCWIHKLSMRVRFEGDKLPPSWVPLYAAPEQRQPLTDEQLRKLKDGARMELMSFDRFKRFARLIEKAHGIE